MIFSEKMKTLRKSTGKSQEQISKEMGIAISTLRNYENGRFPDTYQLKIIKNYYNVSYEYLLDDECQNKSTENKDINKLLNLSDKSISIIKKIPETYSSIPHDSTPIGKIDLKSLNYFIENFNELPSFLYLLHTLQCNVILFKDVICLKYINVLYPSLIYYINELSIKKINKIFAYFDGLIKEITELYLSESNDINMDKEEFEELSETYNRIKEICQNYNLKDYDFDTIKEELSENLNNLFASLSVIQYSISKEISYIKYIISNLINSFLDNIEDIPIGYSNIFDLDEYIIDSKLDKLLKENKIINFATDEKEGVNNGNTRNNKK